MESFKQLGLSEEVLRVLVELGFEKPTEIQEQGIPQLLEGNHDFIGLAQTGTGKTAAFGLPLLERINPYDKFTQALVLAPTRELGQQIAEQLNTFSKYLDRVNVLAVYGGAAIVNQIKALKKNPQHIIIATPGRLIDLIKRKAVKLDQLQYLVLDEADEMLNMGFKDELDKILSFTPDDKLTWLFSATMPKEIKRIVKTYMDHPIEVKVNTKNEVNVNIEHQFAVMKQADKANALMRFLDIHPEMHGLVFCRTRRDTQNLAEFLIQNNYKADAIHGDLSQQQRDRVMKRFKKHDLHVLCATDVAARGIDVNDLTHVFHFTIPDQVEYYTHRSGRTARAGKKGISIAFINGRENGRLNRIAKTLNIEFKKVLIPSADAIAQKRVENWCLNVLERKAKKNIDPDLLERANMIFGNLSKEELIAKILMIELENLNSGSTKDLNDVIGSRDNSRNSRDRRDKRGKKDGDRRDKRGSRNDEKWGKKNKRGGSSEKRDWKSRDKRSKGRNNKTPRYFINIGTRDKVSKKQLMEFICAQGNISKSDVSKIELQMSHSYFEVDVNVKGKIANKFDGITLEDGRELRVNRDN